MTHTINQTVRLGILTFFAAVATPRSHSAEPQAIDLGLSVKWADRNVGASSPLKAGGYYAFGEVAEKDYYDWSTWEHCVDGDMFKQSNLGDESICGTQYDAAHMILGDDWRMPTIEELEELMENYTVDVSLSGPHGYIRCTASDGSYIDLPMAGYMSLDRVVYDSVVMATASGSFYVDAGEEDGFAYYMNGPYYLGCQIKSDGSDWLQYPLTGEINPTLGLQIRPVYCGPAATAVIENPDRVINEVYSVDGCRISSTDASRGINIVVYSDGTTEKIVR